MEEAMRFFDVLIILTMLIRHMRQVLIGLEVDIRFRLQIRNVFRSSGPSRSSNRRWFSISTVLLPSTSLRRRYDMEYVESPRGHGDCIGCVEVDGLVRSYRSLTVEFQIICHWYAFEMPISKTTFRVSRLRDK